MSRELEIIDSAELSARLRRLQNSGAKVIIIEMNLNDHRAGRFGNTNPSTLADAIYRRDGANDFAVIRDRVPREIAVRKRERLTDSHG